MPIVRYTNKRIKRLKDRTNAPKVRAATEGQIAAWKREEGIRDSTLGPAHLVPPATNVGKLRKRLRLSQEGFARRYLLPLRTVQEWEQGRREPSESARVLLYAISRDPKAVAKALGSW